MTNRIGLRLEDKNEWERRVPLTPSDVGHLIAEQIPIVVEKFPRRAFDDAAYAEVGATLVDSARDCEFIAGVKEIPVAYFRPGGAYLFFSHTIKGQPYNMKMLAAMVANQCTLIDYELVADEAGRRLIFFGRYAGIAGMMDTLWTLDRRLKALGKDSPFAGIRATHQYPNLGALKEAVSDIGSKIVRSGVPSELAPLVVGFAGYGNVSMGAQEILDLLPLVEVAPAGLDAFIKANSNLCDKVVKVVYKEKDLVQPLDASRPFVLEDYYDHPEKYGSIFEPNLRSLSVLVNCIYWDERYPKLANAKQLRELFSFAPPKLLVVGDITCDVDGSLACTVRDTEPGDPVYIYNPVTGDARSGFDGAGIAVMAVGNLPTELPVEASETFSEALTPYIPDIARADFGAPFASVDLPDPIKRAVILWRGEFTPKFMHMQEFLRKH